MAVLAATIDALGDELPVGQATLLLGVMRDKEVGEMLRALAGSDVVYMAEDAQMGYPAVRFGVPDNHFHVWFVGMRKAMEMMAHRVDRYVPKERKNWLTKMFVGQMSR